MRRRGNSLERPVQHFFRFDVLEQFFLVQEIGWFQFARREELLRLVVPVL
jgi:hypothetical protein